MTELRCSYDPETRGGDAPDGRKVKGTLHWVSAAHALNAEVRLYDPLFTDEEDASGAEGDGLLDGLNPDSLTVLENCKLEPALADLALGETVQFERQGYFCLDADATPDKPVFNRTVGLRDSWAKEKAKGKAKGKAKPVNLSIEIGLREGDKAKSISITPSGEIVLADEDGKEVASEYMDRALHYERPDRPDKGPKIQGRHKQTDESATVGGLKELARYDSIFVIDTNTRALKKGTVSAACFIRIQFFPDGEKFKIVCEEGRLNIYEFHNVGGNPEFFSILKVANDVLKSESKQAERNIAIVTDTELDSHDDINSRTTPIYGPHYLPVGFTLLYASSDTGQEVLNRLIRFCDRRADIYLSKLKKGGANAPGLHTLSEDNSVKYRFTYYNDLEIINPVVGGVNVGGKANIAFYGMKSKKDHRGSK